MGSGKHYKTEKKAWEILSDPSSPEKKWLAASKIVEGKRQSKSNLPAPLGIMLSILGAGAASAGGIISYVMSVSFFSYWLGTASLPNNDWASYTFAGTIAFLGAYIYGSIFNYQKDRWKGGKAWDATLLASQIALATIPCLLVYMVSSPFLLGFETYLSLALFALTSCLGIGLGAKTSRAAVANLNKTIGASRVYEPMQRGLTAGLFFLCLPYLTSATNYGVIASLVPLMLTCIVGGSAYLTIRKNKSYRTETSLNIGGFLWHPLLLTSAFSLLSGLVAALATGTIFLSVPTLLPSTLAFYGTLAAVLGAFYGLSLGGALLATRQNKQDLFKELENLGDKLPSAPRDKEKGSVRELDSGALIKKESA